MQLRLTSCCQASPDLLSLPVLTYIAQVGLDAHFKQQDIYFLLAYYVIYSDSLGKQWQTSLHLPGRCVFSACAATWQQQWFRWRIISSLLDVHRPALPAARPMSPRFYWPFWKALVQHKIRTQINNRGASEAGVEIRDMARHSRSRYVREGRIDQAISFLFSNSVKARHLQPFLDGKPSFRH